MPTLVYAPEVEIRIATASGEVIDVSEDISRASVNRRTKAVSRLDFILENPGRKYDGLFSPQDRVVCYMRRIKRVLTFAGYLDSVPLFSTYPGSIRFVASCTLKRLQHFYWDPGTEAADLLLNSDNPEGISITDGGLAKKTVRLLNEVAGWPKEQIHIGAVPSNWFDRVGEVAQKMVDEAERARQVAAVGSSHLGGRAPEAKGLATVGGIGKGTGALPATVGKISWFGGPNGGAYGNMALSGESGTHPRDPWYCAMRWPYLEYRNGSIEVARGVTNLRGAIAWWRDRKILVVNPRTNKAICVRAADWGPGGVPSADRRIIDVSRTALGALAATTDDVVHVAFAPADMALGPVATGTRVADTLPDAVTQGPGAIGPINWGNPDARGFASENIVSIQSPWGGTVQVNKHAANRYQGFLNDLHAAGYQAKSIGGYANRNKVGGGSGKSTHSWGTAIDIDPFGLGNGFDRGTTSKIGTGFKGDAWIIALARKWGLGWGGEWGGKKDWMHFEVIGAPETSSRYAKADPKTELEGGGYTPGAGSEGMGPDQLGEALFNVFEWLGGNYDPASDLLSGIRALMNDQPLMQTVSTLMQAGMRDYCSAPNGDFIAWFPDYFGHYGTAAKMIVQDIEISEEFAVAWSDESLRTHVFVTSSTSGREGEGDASSIEQQMMTAGIASVEYPTMMKALFNLDEKLFADNAKAFLNRFGARPEWTPMNNITGARQEFFFATFLFMLNWAQQYSAQIGLSFMPEIFPGMLLVFPRFGVQAYVQEVRHECDLGGGGFTTSPTLIAWSTIGDNKAVKGLPKGGRL